MHLRRRPGGEGAPVEDDVQQRLAVLAAGPAGEGEPRHLTLRSVPAAHFVTPARSASRAFDALYTTKDVGKGTGLGLDIARRIVMECHGGTITIDSRPGETVLRVRIPFDRPGPVPKRYVPHPAKRAGAASGTALPRA
jgi:hypothetical protein